MKPSDTLTNGVAALAALACTLLLISADAVEHAREPIAVWTLVIAVVAVGVALITLGAVNQQIGLGRQELAVVKEDLAQNKRMIDNALRRARLFCFLAEVIDNDYRHNNEAWGLVDLVLFVHNHGDVAARGITIQLAIPSAQIIIGETNTHGRSDYGWSLVKRRGFSAGEHKGQAVLYTVYEQHFASTYYAQHDSLVQSLLISVRDDSQPPMMYRVMYDDGTTPDAPGADPVQFDRLRNQQDAMKYYLTPPSK